jgi:hypothetical protein
LKGKKMKKLSTDPNGQDIEIPIPNLRGKSFQFSGTVGDGAGTKITLENKEGDVVFTIESTKHTMTLSIAEWYTLLREIEKVLAPHALSNKECPLLFP